MSAQGKAKEDLHEEKEWETDEDDDPDEIGEAVIAAHQLDNPLSIFDSSLQNVTLKNGKDGIITHYKAQQLPTSIFKWIMDLMTRNMKQMYKKSAGGWKPKAKRREMTEVTSRYLVAQVDGKPAGFSHFQFDMDYGREVLYCYEIQIEPDARSFGLGRRIMDLLEKVAQHSKLHLVVLTVFKANLASLQFFQKIGYVVDETCPDEDEKKDYVILSKKV